MSVRILFVLLLLSLFIGLVGCSGPKDFGDGKPATSNGAGPSSPPPAKRTMGLQSPGQPAASTTE